MRFAPAGSRRHPSPALTNGEAFRTLWGHFVTWWRGASPGFPDTISNFVRPSAVRSGQSLCCLGCACATLGAVDYDSNLYWVGARPPASCDPLRADLCVGEFGSWPRRQGPLDRVARSPLCTPDVRAAAKFTGRTRRSRLAALLPHGMADVFTLVNVSGCDTPSPPRSRAAHGVHTPRGGPLPWAWRRNAARARAARVQ